MLKKRIFTALLSSFIFASSAFSVAADDSAVSSAISVEEVLEDGTTADGTQVAERHLELAAQASDSKSSIYSEAYGDDVDVRDGIVSVITVFEFSDGSYDCWINGFGILVTKDCVLIPKNIAVIDPDSQLYRNIKSYKADTSSNGVTRLDIYRDRLNVDLNNYESIAERVHTYVLDGDSKIEATVNPAGGGEAFALLSLSSRINSKPVVIVSDSPLAEGDAIYAVGTESAEISPARGEFFGRLSHVTGTRKAGRAEYVDFEGTFSNLSPGCPLVDVNQVVVGMITDGTSGRGSAVDMKTIEAALDMANIEYTLVKKTSDNTPVVDESTAEVSFDELTALMEKAAAVDRTKYTAESLKALDDAYKSAEAISNDKNASRNRIEKVIEPLNEALNALQPIDHTKDYIRLGMMIGLVVLMIVALIIVMKKLSLRGKEDWEIELEKEERKNKKKEKKAAKQPKEKGGKKSDKKEKADENTKADDTPYDDGESETGVLNDNGESETGVLNEKSSVAVLKNTANGKTITINKNRFVIGKAEDGTDYRIHNDAVSRRHCQILRNGDNFFVEDLKSKNGTYIDGMRLEAHDQEQIYPGQELLIADEKFTFEATK